MPQVLHPDPLNPTQGRRAPLRTSISAASLRPVLLLLGLSFAWKLLELAVAGYAAISAHSPALLAFASDTLVELISAVVVLSQFLPGKALSERRAARLAGGLLVLLACVVGADTLASFALHLKPDTSRSGLAITAASLVVMPLLAYAKRHHARRLGNDALAADAVQSATCAYLALLALLGLAAHAVFGIAWFDDLAALLSLPLLLREARTAWRGHLCSC